MQFLSSMLQLGGFVQCIISRTIIMNCRKGMHIVHICCEMEPIASVGSLATYVTGLSCALQRKGYLVEVILPKYASLPCYKISISKSCVFFY